MNDPDCVELLRATLPALGLRWRGFKNVRRQVCRRITTRAAELGLDAPSYRELLKRDPEERRVLDALCFVTISRFYRDHRILDALRDTFLPRLAEAARERGARRFHVWSAGCASGEEPYTLAILWHLFLAPRFGELELDLVATDFDATVLTRAERGVYEDGSLRELPASMRNAAFDKNTVRPAFRRGITFRREDVRSFLPDAPLDLVLCRNVAFTYFAEPVQRAFAERVADRLVPNGILVVGAHETVPAGIFDEVAPHIHQLVTVTPESETIASRRVPSFTKS